MLLIVLILGMVSVGMLNWLALVWPWLEVRKLKDAHLSKNLLICQCFKSAQIECVNFYTFQESLNNIYRVLTTPFVTAWSVSNQNRPDFFSWKQMKNQCYFHELASWIGSGGFFAFGFFYPRYYFDFFFPVFYSMEYRCNFAVKATYLCSHMEKKINSCYASRFHKNV